MITDKAVIFIKVSGGLAPVYKPGGFDRIEKYQPEKWQEILALEEQINQKWDMLPVVEFQKLVSKYSRVLAIAITRDMFTQRKAA